LGVFFGGFFFFFFFPFGDLGNSIWQKQKKKRKPNNNNNNTQWKDKVKGLPCNSSGREHSQKKILDLKLELGQTHFY
jgi:hypothetical protein